ncbi:uncharacterized protein LOC109712658 [Ananas comosus]|uniref:Uncharacterized protein LOC109712658 n=1 Tax=Ananas comosus TaxID=4615 RepID=A0A6P5FEV3_ANACO|nr:uncharacterized protein LOC109712658 [Ananas comosus]XP_020091954.1 uncharacterized protein LOC109712658 [Ananas comosus]
METAVSSSSPPGPEPDRGAEADASSPPANNAAERGEGEKEEEEEEEAECGFCLFMKGGGCKEEFIAWEKCVNEAEKSGEDMVEKCFQVTSLLRKCMDAHADYYEPILKAEQEIAESVAAEIKDPPQLEPEEVKEKCKSSVFKLLE